jgi:hypothetical protein
MLMPDGQDAIRVTADGRAYLGVPTNDGYMLILGPSGSEMFRLPIGFASQKGEVLAAVKGYLAGYASGHRYVREHIFTELDRPDVLSSVLGEACAAASEEAESVLRSIHDAILGVFNRHIERAASEAPMTPEG